VSPERAPRHQGQSPRLRSTRTPISALVRVALLAVLAIVAAAWAFVRHESITPAPMRVPRPPAPAPTYDPDAGEMPVPEIVAPDESR